MLYWLANHNFGVRFLWIRRLQCDVFGHGWFTYVHDSGWCAWCGRVAGRYPKMRERKPENAESRLTILQHPQVSSRE